MSVLLGGWKLGGFCKEGSKHGEGLLTKAGAIQHILIAQASV